MLLNVYKKFIIDYSKITLLLLGILIGFSLYFAKNFNLDASSDALLLEGDKDLKYLREINERYGSKDFLFLTYTPRHRKLCYSGLFFCFFSRAQNFQFFFSSVVNVRNPKMTRFR